ncbi:MAG: class I SAM-dependent methyltransferase [Nakamurella sp.]
MPDESSWHHGLVARWWSEFNIAEPAELDYFLAAVQRYGSPVLDVGCGAGRVLLPLAGAGIAIDGIDASADMIARARALADGLGLSPGLRVQTGHALDLPQRYRTAIMVGVLGVGVSRSQDKEVLARVAAHLEPGGALLVHHTLPYNGQDSESWADWLPEHRGSFPREWPREGMRRRTQDGDEIELLSRLESFDPIRQQRALQMRARLWHRGRVVVEEEYRLTDNV